MIWIDREVAKIKSLHRAKRGEWVDDMKTPSGRIHVGALRGVVIHDLLYKVLLENNIKATFTYVFEDHDPMDAIPFYLDQKKWGQYAGMQLYKVPSPEKGYKNYAEFYASEFQKVFESINCHPQIIWSSQLYLTGKMNGVVKEILDATPKIREIYLKITKKPRPADWHPFNVVCENCQKVGTTFVYKWDGKNVHYRCQPNMVAWAKGCGHEGKVSPYDGRGKMPWKVEWAAKWKVIGVTVEGAGKDHMSAGGSHDIASAICKEVLDYPVPYPVPYEWFTIGGKKMSSSKGVGASAKEVSQILPPDVFRFFIVRTPIGTALDFHPYGDSILHIFDDYDRCLNAYFDKLENKIPEKKQGEVTLEFARIIELSQVRPLPQKRFLLPRFRTIVNLIKAKTDILSFFEKQKKSKLSADEKEILEERVVFAESFLKNNSQPQVHFDLSINQSKFLKQLATALSQEKPKTRESIQSVLFDTLKQGNYKPKEAFQALYRTLIGQDFGPKAGDLIFEMGINVVIKKLSHSYVNLRG